MLCKGPTLKSWVPVFPLPIRRLASVGILGKEREPRVGKLGWHGNFDTGFERNISSLNIPCAGF